MRKLLLLLLLYAVNSAVQAQSNMYFIMQGGANLGFANEGYKGVFHGYSAHFIVGRNFADRAYLGIGFGNERFKGDYRTNDPHDDNQQEYKYDQNVFPIFVDGRLPFGEFSSHSRIGLLANAGYAPSLSAMYDKGFLFKGGFFYLHESPTKMDWTITAAYGYQQLTKNMHARRDFQHQYFNITFGLMFK